MSNRYYTPKIEQFVEGFKYQTKHTIGFSIMDFSKPEEYIKPNMKDYLFDNIVPNLDPVTYPYTTHNENGIRVTIMIDDGIYNAPLQTIKIMLENGNIRAKR